MGKRGIFILIITMLALYVKAQTSITGLVSDSATLAPLANVSVYIANTTIGTSTNNNGVYSFTNLHVGSYQLIVSSVGYGTKVAEINAGAGQHTINVFLSIKVTPLKEVSIGPYTREQNLNRFKTEFIGTTIAEECTIVNEDILNLNFKNNRLTASTDDFLDIDNKNLGYKLRFLVKEFWADYTTKQCHYLGSVIFTPLHGSPKDEKRWAKNRLAVYITSFRHFLISATQNRTVENGYVMRKMIREPNTGKPSNEFIKQKLALFNQQISDGSDKHARDSLQKWLRILAQPRINTWLAPEALHESAIIKPGLQPETFSLQFTDYLYVIYKNKKVHMDFDDLKRFKEAAGYQIAAISLKNELQPTIFNDRGILLTHESLFYEGAWNNWIVSLLPDDYEP